MYTRIAGITLAITSHAREAPFWEAQEEQHQSKPSLYDDIIDESMDQSFQRSWKIRSGSSCTWQPNEVSNTPIHHPKRCSANSKLHVKPMDNVRKSALELDPDFSRFEPLVYECTILASVTPPLQQYTWSIIDCGLSEMSENEQKRQQMPFHTPMNLKRQWHRNVWLNEWMNERSRKKRTTSTNDEQGRSSSSHNIINIVHMSQKQSKTGPTDTNTHTRDKKTPPATIILCIVACHSILHCRRLCIYLAWLVFCSVLSPSLLQRSTK